VLEAPAPFTPAFVFAAIGFPAVLAPEFADCFKAGAAPVAGTFVAFAGVAAGLPAEGLANGVAACVVAFAFAPLCLFRGAGLLRAAPGAALRFTTGFAALGWASAFNDCE
jgi:hypothetical protein